MRERELEVLREELLNVRTADFIGLLDFHNFQDLDMAESVSGRITQGPQAELTWMELKRALWRAAISWYRASTASVRDISRNSLYMLWVPERES